jgi:hypothetical protein
MLAEEGVAGEASTHRWSVWPAPLVYGNSTVSVEFALLLFGWLTPQTGTTCQELRLTDPAVQKSLDAPLGQTSISVACGR